MLVVDDAREAVYTAEPLTVAERAELDSLEARLSVYDSAAWKRANELMRRQLRAMVAEYDALLGEAK